MKIACHRESLLRGVVVAASVAPARTTRPILSGIKIAASEGSVVAMATDLDVAIRAQLDEVIVEQEGEVVVPAATLVEILRSIQADTVRITSDGRHCDIRSSDAEFRLVTDVAEEFPDIKAAGAMGTAVPRAFLEEMFARTAFAAAREVGRYAINGVLVEMGSGRIRFVATDGRRLSVATRPLPDASGEPVRAIVPVKGLHECLKGSEGDSVVRILVDADRVVFSSEHLEVTTKPVEGEFPDYEAVIPTESSGHAAILKDHLLAAVRKASVLPGDDMRSVHFRVTGGSIEVSAEVEGRGQARTSIEAKTENVTDHQVDFNPDFVMEYLKNLPAGMVIFEFRDSGSAGVFHLDGSDDRYVVMPITTS